MSAFYHFHWKREEQADHLVLMTTLAEFRQQDLIDIVDQDILSGNPYPEALIIIAPADGAPAMKKTLRTMIKADALIRLPSDTPIVLVSFDARGQLAAPKSSVLQGEISLARDELNDIVRAGTHHLVTSREAVLVAPHAHHFVHPRRRHSRAFFRTANALIQGEEIGFLALVVLPYLGEHDEKIWIDSSSIASLIYAAYALRGRLAKQTLNIQVQSFSSYEGLDRLWVQDPSKELVLISATASGSLPRIVAEKTRLPEHRVVTLFSTSMEPSGTIIFDARDTTKDLEPLMLETFEEATCPWCRDGSRMITFVGDQFLTDAATVTAYTLVEAIATAMFKAVMGKYRGHSAFSLRQSRERAHHSLYVGLADTLLAGTNRIAISRLVQRHVPASTSHILATKGADSEALAEIVADEIHMLGLPRPQVMKDGKTDSETVERRGVVIVAASIGSGQSFQDASRDLRKPFVNLPRTYLAGVSKHSVAEYHGTLLKDLEHNNKEHKHTLCVVDAMNLPHPNQFPIWAKELGFWKKVRFDLVSAGRPPGKVLDFINRRMGVLSRDIAGNDFFLPNSSNQSLILRPSFAFWAGPYGDEIKQGDVFATIASVLESCRKPSKAWQTPPLEQSPFHMNVLSSENFTRFNDGIIQACLLRAAFPHELSYAHGTTVNHSAKISHLILKMLEHHGDSQGEAILEFLVAICTRQLTLAPADLRRIASHPKNRLPALIATVLRYVADEGASVAGNSSHENSPPA
ncbi:hypothetical protein [Rhizobium leguminosarum]|uniref:hypothetical protein n=1 Tax=Rhizobium leguminosarum TaxID=384 RepID=UPI001441CA3C|nr:hypothetical protein [Rhizobium leguminosarum]NKL04192.1 hypothetical protein [Rhizobium leguminosarum bv. viciae]NKL85572.1 hypothetical protein [Rhizobium leguminosarum bv. viciae]NKL89356.1 hypothetical protein [Rhizobium leguminosarum bv. viciae]NKM90324.1 hypothetical protein [Rhizobium leguminosarum bv. viciae]